MKKHFSLSIANPCSENWAGFIPTLTGGYCGSCSNVVIDFTRLSDEEVISFFKNKPEHTCGRFRADQLKPYAETPLVKVNPGFTLFKAGLVSLFFLLVNNDVQAQDSTAKVKTEEHYTENQKKKKNVGLKTNLTVSGVVTGEDDEWPIPGVNVVLKGTAQGTVTNAEGKFEFPMKLKAGDVLAFYFIGYETKEYKVQDSANDEIRISLALDITIMGKVAVTGVYGEPTTGFHRWWSKVKNLF